MDSPENALFFAFNGVLDAIARLMGGPVMAALYALRGGDAISLGYCFLLSAVSLLP